MPLPADVVRQAAERLGADDVVHAVSLISSSISAGSSQPSPILTPLTDNRVRPLA